MQLCKKKRLEHGFLKSLNCVRAVCLSVHSYYTLSLKLRFVNAIRVLGVKHICDNAMRAGLEGLPLRLVLWFVVVANTLPTSDLNLSYDLFICLRGLFVIF